MTHRIVLALRALWLTTISLLMLATVTLPAASQTFSTLYTFGPPPDGQLQRRSPGRR